MSGYIIIFEATKCVNRRHNGVFIGLVYDEEHINRLALMLGETISGNIEVLKKTFEDDACKEYNVLRNGLNDCIGTSNYDDTELMLVKLRNHIVIESKTLSPLEKIEAVIEHSKKRIKDHFNYKLTKINEF